MAKGYIKLHRAIKDCWIWKDSEPFTRGQAWIDLLLSANHSEKKILFEGNLKTIQAGQFLTSLVSLSDKWKWDRKKVRKFLDVLEADNMITTDRTSHGTTITIVNWGKYQIEGTTDGTADGQHMGQQWDNSRDTNKNDKECIKNDKEIYCVDFEKVWAIYPRHTEKKKAYSCYKARLKEGFSEAELLQATTKYAEECKKDNREQKYIKLASTFFGVNTPFADYISKEKDNMQDGYFIFPIDEYYVENPPYFGFPEEWFKDGQLVTDRIIPIRQLPYKNSGTNKPRDYSKEQLMQMYEERKGWYECNSR